MTKQIILTRRAVIASGIALGVGALAPAARAAAPLKVAGIHASPVENACNSCLHKALQDAAKEGVIEYVFSEGVSGTDYPRAMREYAEQGNKLIIGEALQANLALAGLDEPGHGLEQGRLAAA